MRVLVTGGYGFLGHHVCKELENKGHQPLRFHSSEYNLIEKDHCKSILETHYPDAVIHLAARVGGIGANRDNPATFAYENLMMGTNIIQECYWSRIKKLVIAGTICSYAKFTPIPFKEKDFWEGGYPEETNAPYAWAKKMLLVLSQAYRQQYGCNFVFLLPVNLYGPRDNFDLNSSHVIPAMIRKFHEAAINNEPVVTLWGDGTPTREFLYVEDCAKAFVKTLESYDSPEPMNIGSGKEIVMTDLANKIKELVGYVGEIRWDSSKPNGQPRRCLDTSRAKEKIEWESTTTLDEGLKKTYQWFLENKEKT